MSARSTKPRRQIILGPIKCLEQFTVKLVNSTVDHRIAGIPLSAVEPQNTIRENKVKRLIEKFENHKIKKIAYSGYEIDGEDQPVQQRIARLDRRHEPHRDLRTLRKFFQTALSWLQCLLGNGNNLLQLRKKYEVYAKSNGVRPEQPWRHLNPWIRDKEKQKTWSSARSFWKTKDVPPCEADAKKRLDRESTEAIQRYSHYGTLGDEYRKSLSDIGWEETTTQYCTTGSALEKHIYIATRAERIQIANS